MADCKRIAAVNDLSGYGRCSLTVALPILSVMSAQVCPLPTAVLSAHTGYPRFTFRDLAGDMDAFVEAWRALDVSFDAIFTGFLGSAGQIASVRALFDANPAAQRIVDPVMGDGGVIYKTYTPQMCDGMRSLCDGAHIITPNLTEACLLARLPYPEGDLDDKGICALLDALDAIGARQTVVTGVPCAGQIVNAVRADGQTSLDVHKKHAFSCSGTGDIFASVVAGATLAGAPLVQAVRRAGRFVADCVEYTLRETGSFDAGVIFEPLLGELL